MSEITNKLFDLIANVAKEDEKEHNLNQVNTILECSNKFKKNDLADIAINFKATRSLRLDPKNRAEKTFDLLTAAIHFNRIEIVKRLVEEGMDVDGIKEKENALPLWEAIKCQNLPIIEFLINKGADVDRKYEHAPAYHFPLQVALSMSSAGYPAARLLLLNNANPEIVVKDKDEAPSIIAEKDKDPRFANLIKSAISLRRAINKFDAHDKKVFEAMADLNLAFSNDFNFVMDYLVKMAEITVLQSKGEYNPNSSPYFHPVFLGMAIKELRIAATETPNAIVDEHFQSLNKLIDHLKEYNVQPTIEDNLKLFTSEDEKQKTIKVLTELTKKIAAEMPFATSLSIEDKLVGQEKIEVKTLA